MSFTSRPTNVLHVTPCLAPAWAYGPTAHEVLDLAIAQRQRGDRVTVLTTDALAPHERLPSGESTVEDVRVIRLRNLSGAARTWLDLSTPLGIRRHLRMLLARHEVDVVHLHEVRTVENAAVAGALPDHLTVVLSSHRKLERLSQHSRIAAAWDALVGDRVLSKVRHVVVGTQSEADQIRALCKRRGFLLEDNQISIIANGADLTWAAMASALDEVYKAARTAQPPRRA